jgi:AraC family transcriptional regulator, regulatory protein of adaptative response / methylated-DNA-[protein]-cysteine methyltransferase
MTMLPSNKTMYAALVNRDSTYEGIFYAGIKTTGIFCRPTCPARKPRMENVEFFSSVEAAIEAGYRPCARCHPLEALQKPDWVSRLQSKMANSVGQRLTNADLKRMGIDPSTANRHFKQSFGMTFQAYQRAHQMGEALSQIRQGEKVISAQVDQGYSSASGFWSAFRNVFGETPNKASNVKVINAGWIETPLGPLLALADDRQLYLLDFVDRKGLDKEILVLRKSTNSVVIPGENPLIRQVEKELKDYFSGASLHFSIPVSIGGSPFEQKVWTLLQTIPPGETWSYQRLARLLDNPQACRAVGNANGRNRLVLVVPCHRVVRADGSLGGYGGGVWRKRWLLEHERKFLALRRQNSIK